MRQQEETYIMENIIYNELITRGYSVDFGIVKKRSKTRTISGAAFNWRLILSPVLAVKSTMYNQLDTAECDALFYQKIPNKHHSIIYFHVRN